MRVLFFCTKYSLNQNDKYLTNELVLEFISRGYEVDVVAFGDIYGLNDISEVAPNLNQYIITSKSRVKYWKYAKLWLDLIVVLIKLIFQKNNYKISIAFAPLSVYFPVVVAMPFFKIEKRICVFFDFFPRHQVIIGSIQSWLEKPFFYFERFLLSKFHFVSAMSPANMRHIEKYYQLPKSVNILHLPIWGVEDKTFVDRRVDGAIRIVFGGQVVKGRSLDFLIEFVRKIRHRDINLTLTLFSSGIEYDELRQKYDQDSSFVTFNSRMSRNEYVNALSSFHIGAVVTDPRVTFPTFPSKIIDYINAGLPCLCFLERESDVDEVFNDENYLHVNHFNFDDHSIDQAVIFFANLNFYKNTTMMKFAEKFKVEFVVDRISQL